MAASAPVSIVFVIDNSGSMSDGMSGNDPDQARFRIVRELMDSIRLGAPGSEAGLVVFSNRLHFDDRDNPFFKPAFPADTSQHDAYIPLTDLDGLLPDGRKGIDTLNSLLNYTDDGNLIHATSRPPSRVNTIDPVGDLRNGTDITLAFQAAKTAMEGAKSPKDRQVILFLSDGEPSTVDDIRMPMANEFMLGENVPKTLVVFFRATANPFPPNTIVTMVENIRANGYSAANPKSAYYAVNTPGTQLIGQLLSGIQETTTVRHRVPRRPVPGSAPAKPGYGFFTGNEAVYGSFGRFDARGRRLGAAMLPQATVLRNAP